MIYKKNSAFSLIELSVVILVVGIFIAGVTTSTILIRNYHLQLARSVTESSDVSSIKDLVLWLDVTALNSLTNSSDSTNIGDNETIKTWVDRNLGAKKFTFTEITSGGGPIYKFNGINNLPSLFFDGTLTGEGANAGDCLAVPYSMKLNPPQFTIFAVTKPVLQNSAGSFGAVFSSLLADSVTHTGGYILYKATWNAGDNTFEFDTGNSNGGQAWNYMHTNINLNKPYIVTSKLTGSLTSDIRSIYTNGALAASQTGVVSFVNDGTSPNGSIFSIGCYSTSSRFYNGYTSEIIIFDRALSDEERVTVEKYLSKKYSILLSG
jgi:prepilin-type N-terminal cleavage/methylation domain-containing protein